MENWLSVLGWLFSTVTVAGNGFVIFLVAKNRRLHSSANWLVLSLAVADFGVGVVVYPLAYFCQHPACNSNLYIAFFWLFVHSSVTNLCVLTWDRYAAIVHPFSYNASVTERRTKTVILIAWLIPLVISLSLFVGMHVAKSTTAQKALRLTSVSGFDVISCALILYAVVRILCVARAQAHQESTREPRAQSNLPPGESTISREHPRQNAAGFIIAIVVFFLLCHLSVNGLIVWIMIFYAFDKASVSQVVVLLLLANSAVNPFVYAFFKSDIRMAIKKLIGTDESVRTIPSRSSKSSSSRLHNSFPTEACTDL